MSKYKVINVSNYQLDFSDSRSMIKYCESTYEMIYNKIHEILTSNPKLECLFNARGYLNVYDEFGSQSYLCLGEGRISATNKNLYVISINNLSSLNFNKEILNDTIIHELTHYLQKLDGVSDPSYKFDEYYSKIYNLVKDDIMIAKVKQESPKHSLDFTKRLTGLIKRPANEIFHIATDPNDPRLKGVDPWRYIVKVVYSDD